MSIQRPRFEFEREFTKIPNAWVRDPQLSRRARGLLAELMSHRPGWRVSVASLVAAGTEGRDAVRGAIRELVDAGYLEVTQEHGERGRFNEVNYVMVDPSGGKSTGVGFADIGSADIGSADIGESATNKKTKAKKTMDLEEQIIEAAIVRVIEAHERFAEAWEHWPKKVDRKRSEMLFVRVAKKRPEIFNEVVRFGDAYAATTEVRFVPALSRWIDEERWTDSPPTVTRKLSTIEHGRMVDAMLAGRDETRALSAL